MRRGLAMSLIAVVMVSAPLRTSACSCTLASLNAHLGAATFAFVGTVSRVSGEFAVFDVERVFKGDVSESTSVKTTGPCAVEFAPATRYVVFAKGSSAQLNTSLCDGSGEDYVSAELALKPIKTLHPSPRAHAVRTVIASPRTGTPARGVSIALAMLGVLGSSAALVRFGKRKQKTNVVA